MLPFAASSPLVPLLLLLVLAPVISANDEAEANAYKKARQGTRTILFDKIDTDWSGDLDQNELSHARLRRLVQDVREGLKTHDLDKSGDLDIKEFAKMYGGALEINDEDDMPRLAKAFKDMQNEEGDKSLTSEGKSIEKRADRVDFQEAMGHVVKGWNGEDGRMWRMHTFPKLLDDHDEDGDGRISRHEFTPALRKRFGIHGEL